MKVKGNHRGKPKNKSTLRNQFRKWLSDVVIELIERQYEFEIQRDKPRWVKEVLEQVNPKNIARVEYYGVLEYHEEYIKILEKRNEGEEIKQIV